MNPLTRTDMKEEDENRAIIRCLNLHEGNILHMAEKLVLQEQQIDCFMRCDKCRKIREKKSYPKT